MEFRHTLEVLHNQVDEIKRLTAYLEQNDTLRSIEIDLLLEKLRDIYDVAIDLKSAVADEDEVKIQTKTAEIQDTNEAFIEEKPNAIEFDISAGEAEQEITREDEGNMDLVDEKPEIVADSNSGNDAQNYPKEEANDNSLLADQFKVTRTLNQEISEQSEEDNVTFQMKKQPISSIKSAIGLNEKFELISELFGGDKVKFEQTLEVLNQAGSFVEAFKYLEDNFKWDMKSPYVQRILELIRRKLIVNRNEQ